jgi:transposase/IS5 family transposase
MGQIFHPYEPDQGLLLPPSLRDWLPEDHLAHFVSDTVDELDLSAFLSKYEQREDGRGQLAYHPALMLKLLIYAYSSGVFSSRRIASAIEDQVSMRYLAAGNLPSHRTIARFRLEHLERFQGVFVEVVRIAKASGLVKMGTLAVDGTKLKANASKHKAMSYGRMQAEERSLKEEIRRITELARKTDEAEDAEFGPDFRGNELPAELRRRKDRLAVIREAKKRLEAEQAQEDEAAGRGLRREEGGAGRKLKRPNGVPPDKKQANFTDPESRIMKTSSGFEQSYNAQIAVDAAEQIIVAADVSACAADSGELLKMQEAAEKNTGARSRTLLADAGYRSEANFVALEQRGIEGLVALGRGESVPNQDWSAMPATTRMRRRMRSKRGRQRYRRRKTLVEPVFGWVKQVLGFRNFLLRGCRKVKAEWNLVCLALNLRRMSTKIAWG